MQIDGSGMPGGSNEQMPLLAQTGFVLPEKLRASGK